jgi:hypothetical protein
MTSPARIRVSPPTWGPISAAPEARPSPPRGAVGAAAGVLRAAAGLLRAAARARREAADLGPDAIAAIVLLVGWTLLWVLFVAGIVEPAASLRLVR